MPYITPETTPPLKKRRCLFIPDDPRWLAAVNGAVSELLKPYNWEQTDGITPDEAADTAATMFYDYLQECSGMEIGMLIPSVSAAGAPSHLLRMNGDTHDEADYPELFTVLPDGWKDGDTFTLPDMAKHTVAGAVGSSGFFLGDRGGAENITLTLAQIPSHNHTYGQGTSTPGGASPAASLNNLNSGATANAGGGGSHSNMPPYMAVHWLIVAK